MHGLADACILDVDLMVLEGVWVIERFRRLDAGSPLIAFTANTQSEWEEEAFLRGITTAGQTGSQPAFEFAVGTFMEIHGHPAPRARAAAGAKPTFRTTEPSPPRVISASQTLDVLSDFSSILTHSLDAEAMLKQFLLFLREILSVNRAAIFLNRPSPLTETPLPEDRRRLRAVAAIGLSPGLLEHLGLSLDSGIGGQLPRLGRILRRDSDEARAAIGGHGGGFFYHLVQVQSGNL